MDFQPNVQAAITDLLDDFYTHEIPETLHTLYGKHAVEVELMTMQSAAIRLALDEELNIISAAARDTITALIDTILAQHVERHLDLARKAVAKAQEQQQNMPDATLSDLFREFTDAIAKEVAAKEEKGDAGDALSKVIQKLNERGIQASMHRIG